MGKVSLELVFFSSLSLLVALAATGLACPEDALALRDAFDTEESSLLQLDQRRTSSASIEGSCMRVVHATFNSSRNLDDIDRKIGMGGMLEPYRLIDAADWDRIRLPYRDNDYYFDYQIPVKVVHERLMVMLAEFTRVFEKLPHVRWHIGGGSLIAAQRTGSLTPWDGDIDVATQREALNTESTLHILYEAYGPEIANATGRECADEGNCRMYALPNSTILLVHNKVPTPRRFIAKVIDRITGACIDFDDDVVVANETVEATMANGLRVQVPKVPSATERLASDYPDTMYRMSNMGRAELYKCVCPIEHFKEIAGLQDSFDMRVMQPCSDSGAPWRLADVDEAAACCVAIGPFSEAISLKPRFA